LLVVLFVGYFLLFVGGCFCSFLFFFTWQLKRSEKKMNYFFVHFRNKSLTRSDSAILSQSIPQSNRILKEVIHMNNFEKQRQIRGFRTLYCTRVIAWCCWYHADPGIFGSQFWQIDRERGD